MSTPQYANGMWGERTLREWVPLAVDDIVAKYNPVRIILFGSVARGEEGADSDVDLLVVLDEVAPTDRARLMGEMRFRSGRRWRSMCSPPTLRSASGAGT